MEKGVEGAKEVAAEAYQTVKDEADQQGMSGDKSIVDKVRRRQYRPRSLRAQVLFEFCQLLHTAILVACLSHLLGRPSSVELCHVRLSRCSFS